MRKLLLLLAFALGTGLAYAQTPTGNIQGTVVDEQGAVVVGASVTATNNATGLSKQVVTDGSGRFEVLFVLPGTYTVTADAKGFRQEKREGVIVEVSKTVALPLTLSIGQASQTVEVVATTGTLETDTSSLNTVIGTRSITDLPLNGRNPFSLETLVPGVSNVGSASTPHIGGSRNANNEMLIDGMTNILPENNVGNNETAYQPIVDSVQEFSVQTSVLPAEYGRFSGGAISLVTKSGGDQFHGTLFEFVRNSALDAEYYTFNSPGSQPSLYRYQTGGTIGGPVPLIDKAKR
ncbi:MAG: carboxypeptidase-like regulatory domain-containing protein, partial [Candidatus Acidiferrales bacterium]